MHAHTGLHTLTFDDLLGAGVVHLLLGGVGGKHAVEHIRFSLHTHKTDTEKGRSHEEKRKVIVWSQVLIRPLITSQRHTDGTMK